MINQQILEFIKDMLMTEKVWKRWMKLNEEKNIQ